MYARRIWLRAWSSDGGIDCRQVRERVQSTWMQYGAEVAIISSLPDLSGGEELSSADGYGFLDSISDRKVSLPLEDDRQLESG